MKKIGLISLGCPKNLVDSEAILSIAAKFGYKISSQIDKSDIAIINTCSFIKSAKEESIDFIFDLVNLKKEGKIKSIIVSGCLPQRYPKEMAEQIPEVDAWIGTSDFHNLPRILENVARGRRALPSDPSFKCIRRVYPAGSKDGKAYPVDSINRINKPKGLYPFEENKIHLTPPHYAYIKIAEGCNNRCSYCIIPNLRGRYRSRPIESIIEEINKLSKNGKLKEINLISQDTTSYGIDIDKTPNLARLLKKICALKKVPWIRLLYTHPAHFSDELIELIKNKPSICQYIDLPLQHINERILKMMERKVTKKDILNLLKKLRKNIPDLAIRTSFIVGFPGESEEEYKELYNFIKEAKFERMGVFTYSPEEGTRAFNFSPQIAQKLKEERFEEIMRLQQNVAKEVNGRFLGKTLDVLIEEKNEGDKNVFLGRSQYDAPEVDGLVYVNSKKAKPGDIIKVKITDTYEYDLSGYELTQ